MTALIGTVADNDIDSRRQVAATCRIISRHGHEDLTLGHVSVRGEGGRSMWIKRKGVTLGETCVEDVIRADLDDDLPQGRSMHLEAVMHSQAYRTRPDVNAVIHTHPWYATALGAAGAGLEVLSHDGVLFKDGVGLYDNTSGLITTLEGAGEVIDALGSRRAVLMRHHGVLIVGEDIRWATLAAITLERAIKLQSLVSTLGTPTPIDPEVVEDLFVEKYRHQFLDEYWDAWCRELEARGFRT
jgi:ribulose-5-phosphate 4-epimerase/fuculose-1-phosphate aldolase